VTTWTPRRCLLRTVYATAFSWDIGIKGRRGTLAVLWRLALARWRLGALLPGAFPWGGRRGLFAPIPWIAPASAPSWLHRTRSRVVARSSYASVLPEDLYTPTPWSPFPLYADQAARTTPAVVFRLLCRTVWRSSATDQGTPTSWTPMLCTVGRLRRHGLPSTVSRGGRRGGGFMRRPAPALQWDLCHRCLGSTRWDRWCPDDESPQPTG